MRKIDPPHIDDHMLLRALSLSGSEHARAITNSEDLISDRYDLYLAHNGNPWHIAEDNSFEAIQVSLKHLYSTPPTVLSFIERLREEIDGACPVCGRPALGTLDHYLPKATYSEFSFFSKNLIPACDRCNNNRGETLKGTAPEHRPIHPYYDAFLADRVISVEFEGDLRAPKISPVAHGVAGNQRLTVEWHIENIIIPAGALRYLDSKWGILVSEKNELLRDCTSLAGIRESIGWLERYEARSRRSPNCWDSAFYHGIGLNGAVVEYLYNL